MSTSVHLGRRLGNQLYKVAFPIYRPLYRAYKIYADRAEREVLRRFLGHGSVVVDAGANIGIYSEFLAQCVGPAGAVHSFEPSPENFARLSHALSSFSNVRLNQFAVSNKSEDSLLYVSDDLNVDHRAYPTPGEKRTTIPIRSITLDDYFKPGERVDLIKLDIQGYELHALRGARRLLEDNPVVRLLVEFWPYGLRQASTSAEAFLEFLRNHDFAIYLLKGETLVKCDRPFADPSDPTGYVNLFIQKPDRA